MPTMNKPLLAKPKVQKAAAAQALAPRSVAGRVVLLSDPEMRPAVDRLKAKIASDPQFALSLLQSAGIVTAKGKLSRRFGG